MSVRMACFEILKSMNIKLFFVNKKFNLIITQSFDLSLVISLRF